jgi:hypothetical protein
MPIGWSSDNILGILLHGRHLWMIWLTPGREAVLLDWDVALYYNVVCVVRVNLPWEAETNGV